MYLAKRKISISFKKVILILIFILFIAYINGVLSNIRNGFEWNDFTYINKLGGINNKWPTWLSHQFCWAYSYITSPLANLNLNILNYDYSSFSLIGLFVSIIPIFISKRLFAINALAENLLLYNFALTATTGYVDSVLAAGFLGIYLIFFYQIIIIFYIMRVCRKNKKYSPVYLSNLCMLVVFMFFYNTFTFSGTSLIIPYIILCPLLSRIKFVGGRV